MEMLRVKEKYCMVQQGEIINQDAAKMLIKLFSEYTKELRLLTFQERRMSLSLVVRGNSQLKLFGQSNHEDKNTVLHVFGMIYFVVIDFL